MPGTGSCLHRGWTKELVPYHPPSQLLLQHRRAGWHTYQGPSSVVAGKQRVVAGTGRAAGALQHGAVQSPGALRGTSEHL